MFEELLLRIAKRLDKENIPYMIIGGQAVLVYGIPRLTEDIDITLGIDIETLYKVLTACKRLRLERAIQADNEFVKKTNVLICRDPATGIRIDFIFSFLDYERKAIKRAKSVIIKGYKVKFASREDLIIHKMFAGRASALEDVKNLTAKNKNRLGIKYIKKRLAEFSTIEEFKDILRKFEELIC